MLATTFHILATLFLAFIANSWSHNGGLNMAIKLTFTGTAILGGVILTKDLISAGWL